MKVHMRLGLSKLVGVVSGAMAELLGLGRVTEEAVGVLGYSAALIRFNYRINSELILNFNVRRVDSNYKSLMCHR